MNVKAKVSWLWSGVRECMFVHGHQQILKYGCVGKYEYYCRMRIFTVLNDRIFVYFKDRHVIWLIDFEQFICKQ